MAKLEAICFDVKKLDQCSVLMYADDAEITGNSSVNYLGIIITNMLKWDSHINQRLSKAQLKLFLKEKGSLFYKYEIISKFIQKLHFINYPVRVRCKDEHASELWIGNFLLIVTTIRASFTTTCCQSVFFWFEMIFLCWTKFTTLILPLRLMIIGNFSRYHAVTVLQQKLFEDKF